MKDNTKSQKHRFFFRMSLYALLGLLGFVILEYSSLTHHGFMRQYALKHAPQKRSYGPFYTQLAQAAETRLTAQVRYDGRYIPLSYPMGDVPPDMGVCTDVIIRSYRQLGLDLQEKVHIDMQEHFWHYPKMWRLTTPDYNIDHRRVPNLMTFLNRAGASLPLSLKARDYQPGDLVTWDVGGGNSHIGIVSTQFAQKSQNPLIVHNIARGPELSDMLFDYKIIGHYRYGSPLH